MHFFDRLYNWLKNIFNWNTTKLIPEAIQKEDENSEISKNNNLNVTAKQEEKISNVSYNSTQEIESKNQPKHRLNKFELFKLEIENSYYFKSLSENSKKIYTKTVDNLYNYLGGHIPRKQPFVIKTISTWHAEGKIEHFTNIIENWNNKYSLEFEKYFSKYKDNLANSVVDSKLKSSLEFIQANPDKINLDTFPPVIEEIEEDNIKTDIESISQIIRPSYSIENSENKNLDSYSFETKTTDDVEELFDLLFCDIEDIKNDKNIETLDSKAPVYNDDTVIEYTNEQLEQLFDAMFGNTETNYNENEVNLPIIEAKDVDCDCEINDDFDNLSQLFDDIFNNNPLPAQLLSDVENPNTNNVYNQ